MIIVLDPALAEADLARGGLSCGSCSRSLLPWGYARTRTIEGADGTPVRVRPRRVRCPSCRKTHVLIPAVSLPRCSASSERVGQVLLAAAQGGGHRTIAADLDRSEATVRRWLRRARANAGWLSAVGMARLLRFDPDPYLRAIALRATPLAQAVDVLAAAAAAAVRVVGPVNSPWQIIAVLTGGRLLTGAARAT